MFSEKIQSFSSFSPTVINQVVAILASYENMTPKIASELLADYNFTNQLRSIHRKAEQEFENEYGGDDMNGTQREDVIEVISAEGTKTLIESRLMTLIEQKERERANAVYEKSNIEERLKKKDEENNTLARKIVVQEESVQNLNKKLTDTIEDVNGLKSNISDLRDANKTLNKSFSIAKWIVGLLVALIVIFLVEPAIGVWLQKSHYRDAILPIRFIAYLISLTAFVGIGVGITKTWKCMTIIDTVASVIGALWVIFIWFFEKPQ